MKQPLKVILQITIANVGHETGFNHQDSSETSRFCGGRVRMSKQRPEGHGLRQHILFPEVWALKKNKKQENKDKNHTRERVRT